MPLAGEPAVSVVMATRNRAERLARALDALDAQEFGEPFELIVVDDASSDATADVLEARADADGPLRVLRREASGGPAGGRNTGWREARAPLVAFTDDDCEPGPGWLAALAAAARANRGAVVQGRTEPNPAELDRLGPFSRTLDVRELGPWYPACNMAYPRELLERLDGFDEALPRGEDTDLAWRARELGAAVVFAPDALVHHAVMQLGPAGRLRLATAWAPAFRNFARHPGLRTALDLGLFWRRSHSLLLLAMVAAVLARRVPPAALLVLPYARNLRIRMAAERAHPSLAPYYVANDALEIGAAAVGSARAGTLVL